MLVEEALIEDQSVESHDIEQLIARLEKLVHEAATGEQYPITWVKLDRYVELSGDTVDAVQSRRKAGKWLNGEQCKVVDGRLWINLTAMDEWIEAWGKNRP